MARTTPLPGHSTGVGVFQVEFQIGDPQGERWEPLRASVDTGSSYTCVPEEMLRRLGVEPLGRREFVLADETPIDRDIGQTWVRIGEEALINLIVCSPAGETPLLGSFTLEAFGLAVDPVRRRLFRVPRLLKGNRSR